MERCFIESSGGFPPVPTTMAKQRSPGEKRATEEDPMIEDQFVFNGIDGSSGDYLLDPMTTEQIAAVARGEDLDPAHLRELEIRRSRENEPHFGVVEEVEDPTDLSQAGWGVIFAFE